MDKIIQYYFAPISPWTYLGNQRFVELAEKYKAKILYKPCNILKVFERTGGLPAGKRPPVRQRYRMAELKRWRAFLNVELNLQPKYFPASDDLASRMILSCDTAMAQEKLSHAVMRATWAEERNISDEQTLLTICTENQLDGKSMLEKAKSESMVLLLAENTNEAVNSDVFGSPTYIYEGEVYWGQDRLDFLERALEG